MQKILRALPLACFVLWLGLGAVGAGDAQLMAQPAGGKLNIPVNDAISSVNDYAAFITQENGEDVLVFTSDRLRLSEDGERIVKVREAELYRSKRPLSARDGAAVNQGWGDPTRISAGDKLANRQYNRGAFARHGDVIVFAAEQQLSTDGNSSSHLFSLWMTTDNFASFTELSDICEDDAWDTQPAFSRDGKILFFVSNRLEDRKDSVRDNNIWYSRRMGSDWSAPELVPDINTPGEDYTPSVGPDGYFYLASNWKGSAAGDFDIFRCKMRMNGMPLGPPRKLEESFADDYARRPLLPDGLEYNTGADELFPHVAQWGDEFLMFLTSNRGNVRDDQNSDAELVGGLDLYAFDFPWPKICVQVHVRRKVVTAGGNPDNFPWQTYKSNLIIEEVGGERRTISSDTEFDLQGHKEYSLSLADANVDCGDCMVYYPDMPGKQSSNALHMFTGGQDSCLIRDTIEVVCMLRRDSVSLQTQDAAGFFITGYWKPTTNDNYKEFEQRWENGALAKSGFVDPFDFNYAATAAKVEDHFEQHVYQRIDNILQKFENTCLGIKPVLRISVHGYTDDCGLTDGVYTADGDIVVGGTKIAAGQRMWASKLPRVDGGTEFLPGRGQRGNVILSKLRAHFTAQTITETMRERSKLFRRFYEDGQIIIDADGFGVFGRAQCDDNQRIDNLGLVNQPVKFVPGGLTEDKEKTGRYKFKTGPGGAEILDEPCNNPLNRRMTVYFDVVDGSVQQNYTVGRCGFESPEYLRWELKSQGQLIARQRSAEEERAKRALQGKEVELNASVETLDDPTVSESAGPVYVLQLANAGSQEEALMVQTILRLLNYKQVETYQAGDSDFRFVDSRRFEFESDATSARKLYEQRVAEFYRGLAEDVVQTNNLEQLLQSTISTAVEDSE